MSVIILVNSLEPAHVIVSVSHEMDIYQTLQAGGTAAISSTDRGDQSKLGKNEINKTSCGCIVVRLTKGKRSNDC